jgi:hypothetical protein
MRRVYEYTPQIGEPSMDDGSQKNSEQLSEQALVVYRAMYEQISAIKKMRGE